MTLDRTTGAMLAAILAAVLSGCSPAESSGSACSLAFEVTFRGVTYDAAPITESFRHTEPLGSGTLPTCHGERAGRVAVSRIRGVDPAVALAAPDHPDLVLLGVPVRHAPAAVAGHLRYRPG